MNTDKTKTEREKIEEKLHSGMTPKQVIAQGHARSTVYQVKKEMAYSAKKEVAYPGSSEIAELKEEKTRLKLEAEIEEIKSKRDKLPERVARLERQMNALIDHLDRMSRNFESFHNYLTLYILQEWKLIDENAVLPDDASIDDFDNGLLCFPDIKDV